MVSPLGVREIAIIVPQNMALPEDNALIPIETSARSEEVPRQESGITFERVTEKPDSAHNYGVTLGMPKETYYAEYFRIRCLGGQKGKILACGGNAKSPDSVEYWFHRVRPDSVSFFIPDIVPEEHLATADRTLTFELK